MAMEREMNQGNEATQTETRAEARAETQARAHSGEAGVNAPMSNPGTIIPTTTPRAPQLGDIMWEPSAAQVESAVITQFARTAIRRWKLKFNDYPSFYRWSVDAPEQFWTSVWDELGVIGQKSVDARGLETPKSRPIRVMTNGDAMPGAQFFPDARLNFAENLLKKSDANEAIVFWGEDKVKRKITWAELHGHVSRCTQGLKAAGVRQGDRVAGLMPNMPETVIAMLATASLGAVWTSCSPDFGVQGVVDRFGQVEPKVLFAPDGYYLNGKPVDVVDKITAIVKKLPSLREVVVVPFIANNPNVDGVPRAATYPEFVAPYKSMPVEYVQMPFNHPLYILYSSGTTGAPKCVVHSIGGTLLKHLTETQLHSDIKSGDRVFFYTTSGWMMWNWLVSSLAAGATLLLYDGSPFVKRGNILWDYAQNERCTHFGTSAKYLDAMAKLNYVPSRTHAFERLRVLLSTGSPLSPESFDYVYRDIKKDLQLASISGGTDIVGCFVLGNPVLPVHRGEIQCPALGLQVEAFSDKGKRVGAEVKGELVCTRPFPSMPIGFWNDLDDKKYHAAYFERFPGVWHHGDYVEFVASGGMVIHGRSDAVLNPGGVRIGTAEIYRQTEQLAEVQEAVAVAQDWPLGQTGARIDVRVVLFVRLREGMQLDEFLVLKLKNQIRNNATPHHVPEKVVQVTDIPRTMSGKVAELAVRDVVNGHPPRNVDGLANPEALKQFEKRIELQA